MSLTGSYGRLVVRGLLAGLLAGLIAGAVAFVVGEPQLDAAVALETAVSEPHSHADSDTATAAPADHTHEDEPLVSRTGQRAGLFLATSLAGVALGAIFATVAYAIRRAVPVSAVTLSIGLAAAAWLAVVVVPYVKYPPNPPSVGDPETIDQRTLLWLAAVAVGLAAVAGAAYVATVSAKRLSPSARIALTTLTFVVVATVGCVLLPTVDGVDDGFPTTLLWDFRLSTLATQTTLWVSLGLIFAYLSDRSARPSVHERSSMSAM
ncbi:CbtA family protein [Rhodococcus sp. NPDC047139]|uniref:CbtA family protein n=1 Tax=Rhodococcus sp. NPDC047139 TaxID=3155141 RepID=UPI0033E7550F